MITTQQADEIINRASRPGDGAIEDAEQRGSKAYYFFESGATGIVDLNTKAVTINRSTARRDAKGSDAQWEATITRRDNPKPVVVGAEGANAVEARANILKTYPGATIQRISVY